MFEKFYLTQALLSRRLALVRPTQVFALLGKYFVARLHFFDHVPLRRQFWVCVKKCQSVTSLTGTYIPIRLPSSLAEMRIRRLLNGGKAVGWSDIILWAGLRRAAGLSAGRGFEGLDRANDKISDPEVTRDGPVPGSPD